MHKTNIRFEALQEATNNKTYHYSHYSEISVSSVTTYHIYDNKRSLNVLIKALKSGLTKHCI